MDIATFIVSLVYIINMLLAIVIIFIERKEPSATWAWLLILFFIPLLGFIIYLFLGQNLTRERLFDWEGKRKIGIEELITEQSDQMKDPNHTFDSDLVDEYRKIIYMHLMNNDAVLLKDNHVEIFLDGKEKFDSLIHDIENAKDYIHIQYYIFRYDGLGKRVVDALTKKAKEGVTVRLLYDGLGGRTLRKKYFQELIDNGGQVGVFFQSRLPLLNIRLNYRNHRKLVNIDGHLSYIGGFNVGDEYLGLKKLGYWRDTHLRILGPASNAIQTRFILDWNQASKDQQIDYEERYFPKVKSYGYVPIQIVSSGPDSEWESIKNGYLQMIATAKKYIYIQTPYFIPDQSLLDALRNAALSGIDVRIMIPNKPDHPFVYWATYSYIGDVIKAGVKAYIYDNGFLHAKMIVVDDKINSVGTANIDVRSFKLNFEVNAFIYDVNISEKLAKSFRDDMEVSSELTMEKYNNRSKLIRFKESISRLLSPIL